MFKAPVRKKVFLENHDKFSEQFLNWAKDCLSGDFKLVTSSNPLKFEIDFSNEEDLTAYLLVWTEPLTYPTKNYANAKFYIIKLDLVVAMYKAPIRRGVLDSSFLLKIAPTVEFLDWSKSCLTGDYNILDWLTIEFKEEGDRTAYLLAWTETSAMIDDIEYFNRKLLKGLGIPPCLMPL
jgi:hypothetical protein